MPNLLKIYKRGFYQNGKSLLQREIQACVKDGVRSYLFVPEQETVTAEEEMARILPDEAPLCFEVTNFTRFANTVFRFAGDLAGKSAGKAERALLMWRAMTELSPVLSVTSKTGSVTPGAVRKMLAAVGEMQSLGIHAADLDKILEKGLSDARLNGKVSDLSKVMKLYKTMLDEKYADSADELDRVNRKLTENPAFLSGAKVYLQGFTSLTEPQYQTVGTMLRFCDVTVLLEMPEKESSAFEFTELADCEKRLLAIAGRVGAQKQVPPYEEPKDCEPSFLEEVGENLWRSKKNCVKGKNVYAEKRERLRLFEARTPYEECDFAASDIKRRVMEEKCRFSDFAIVFRRADAYAGIIDTSLAEANVPIFFSRVREVNSFELIRLIESAFRTVSGGYQRKDLLSYVKIPLCGVTQDEADEFEIYTETWQINGRRFIDETVWNMNPAGYSTRRAEGTGEKLLRIDATKKKAIEPLRKLEDASRHAKNVRETACALVDFLLSLKAEEKLRESAKRLRAIGETDSADETENLFPVVCKALDTLVDVLGDVSVDTGTFLSLLRLLFAEQNVGHIPSFCDAVTVGSADQIRLSEKKHIYLLGVSTGEFPEAVSDQSFFTERDKSTLAAEELPFPLDGAARKNARELYCFSRAFSFAAESVTMISSLADSSFNALSRGEVMNTVCDLIGDSVKIKRIDELDPFERTYTPDYALEHLPKAESDRAATEEALCEAGYENRLRIGESHAGNDRLILSDEMAKAFYGNRMGLTQSCINEYLKCPMSYFCSYVLKLNKSELAEFDSGTVGSLIHAILENFFRKAKETGKLGKSLADLTTEEKERMIDEAAKRYLTESEIAGSHESARTKILCERLKRAALPVVNSLCDEFENCEYHPVFFELSIRKEDGKDGKDVSDCPSPALFSAGGGNEVFVYGKIDRVDSYLKDGKAYLRVIDYKTGAKEFKPEDLEKGENLQMFLYLKALVESKNEAFLKRLGVTKETELIPGGVLYVKSSIPDKRIPHADETAAEESVKTEQKRAGMILDAEENLSAMNPAFLPFKFDEKGNVKEKELLYSEAGWDDLMTTVEKSVLRISDRMRSGEMNAEPQFKSERDNACKYCPFGAVCRSSRANEKEG